MKNKKNKSPAVHRSETKEPLFIGIPNSVSVRRGILLSSKDLIDSLKKYEGLVDLRLRRQNYVVEFKRVVDELLVLNRKLRSHLPKTQLREKEVPVRTKIEPTPFSSHKSHLNLLEEELSRVEARLDTLD